MLEDREPENTPPNTQKINQNNLRLTHDVMLSEELEQSNKEAHNTPPLKNLKEIIQKKHGQKTSENPKTPKPQNPKAPKPLNSCWRRWRRDNLS